MPEAVIKQEAPLCACGCGKRVAWDGKHKRWNEWIQYHRTGINKRKPAVNTDIETYQFADMDLEQAVNSMDERNRRVVILMLMGLTQTEIAGLFGLGKSAVSKIFNDKIIPILVESMRA